MGLIEYVGDRIRFFRAGYERGRGISQEELAKALGVAPNTISRWETATYRPTLDDLEKLARFFGVSILEFFPQDETTTDKKVAALLRTAKQLKPEDLEELRRYAEYRQARNLLAHGIRRRPRLQKEGR